MMEVFSGEEENGKKLEMESDILSQSCKVTLRSEDSYHIVFLESYRDVGHRAESVYSLLFT